MVILHIAALDGKKSAGPNTNVPANVIYGSKFAKSGLYNSNYNCEDFKEKIDDYYVRNCMKNYDIKTLPEPYNNPDLVVFHSMYLMSHVFIARKLKKYNIPYIIVPRVAMTQNAQNKKKLKKQVFNFLCFNKYIENALAIHFLTQNEYEESKGFKYKNYIISGNGTNKKEKTKNYDNTDYTKYIITFIGRIEKYHKGLDILVESFNLGQKEFREYGIKLYLYGPDNNSKKYLEQKIDEYKISDLIEIKDGVYGEEKEKILLDSDLFIHTSRMEGHPTSIIEAISYGVPVLVTPGTNVAKEVKQYNLGFAAELEPESIKNQIIYSYKSRDKFEEITKDEINYSNENFEWTTIMKNTIDKYEKLVESGKK